MSCTILWQTMTKDEWNVHLNACPHSTLLQSYYYAQAMRECHQQTSRHGLIIINGEKAGIVQTQEVSLLKGFIHAITIDRGPLWFKNFGNPAHINDFIQSLDDQYPSRWGRKRRFIPEIYERKQLIEFKNWTKNKNSQNYETFLIDLKPNIDVIRSNLKQKWRNILNKAEKHDLDIQTDTELSTLSEFLKYYVQDKYNKHYKGASFKFLTSLAKYAAIDQNCIIITAREDGEPIASALIFIHGKGATYQCGWVTPYGRDKGANHLVLWQAINALKECGVTFFDLGGFNDQTDGLKKFKDGLGGHAIALIGSYS